MHQPLAVRADRFDLVVRMFVVAVVVVVIAVVVIVIVVVAADMAVEFVLVVALDDRCNCRWSSEHG